MTLATPRPDDISYNAHGDADLAKATVTATAVGIMVYGFIVKDLSGTTLSFKDRAGTQFTDEFFPAGAYALRCSEVSSSGDVLLFLASD